jgi:hypothetical protein
VLALLVAPAALAIEPGLPQRTHALGVSARLGLLRGEPARLERDAGFGFGASFAWFYRPGLAILIHGDHDRFGSANDTRDQLSRTSFTALQALAMPLRGLLPWTALGAGVGVGLFRSPDRDVQPMERTDTVPLVRWAAGLGVEVHRRVNVGVACNYDWVFTGASVDLPGSGGRDVTVFDDTFHLAVGMDYFF